LRVHFFDLLIEKFRCRSITQVPVVGTQERRMPKVAAKVDASLRAFKVSPCWGLLLPGPFRLFLYNN